MTTTNAGVSDAPTLSLEETKRMTYSQLVKHKGETEIEIESLCNLLYQLNKSRTKLESTVDIVNKLNSSMESGCPIMPVTNNMFAQGDFVQKETIVVILEGDYQVEVDKESAINYFIQKLQRVKSKIGLAQKMLASKMLDAERLKQAAAEKYREEKQKESLISLP